jgi:hypothetical protein
MSKTLFTTDNISIIWEYQEKPVISWWYENIWTQKYIKLYFTVHINGRIKSFNHYIKLAKKEFGEWLWLEDYYGWYMLYETLWQLWYKIWDYNEDKPQKWNIIDWWIEECIEEYNDKETFYY